MENITAYSLMTEFMRETRPDITLKEVGFKYVNGLLKNNTIGIREDLPEDEKAAVLCHEIGHLLLHRNRGHEIISSVTDPAAEREADRVGQMLELFCLYVIDRFTDHQ